MTVYFRQLGDQLPHSPGIIICQQNEISQARSLNGDSRLADWLGTQTLTEGLNRVFLPSYRPFNRLVN